MLLTAMNTSQIGAEPFAEGRPAVVQKTSNRRPIFDWKGWWRTRNAFDRFLVIAAAEGLLFLAFLRIVDLVMK